MKYLTAALIFILPGVLLYVFGAYTALELNPANWHEASRAAHAYLSLGFGIVGCLLFLGAGDK